MGSEKFTPLKFQKDTKKSLHSPLKNHKPRYHNHVIFHMGRRRRAFPCERSHGYEPWLVVFQRGIRDRLLFCGIPIWNFTGGRVTIWRFIGEGIFGVWFFRRKGKIRVISENGWKGEKFSKSYAFDPGGTDILQGKSPLPCEISPWKSCLPCEIS